jgi:DNA-binding MarR family transcriptional regulator
MLMKTTSVGLSSSVSSVLHLLHRAGQCADELFAANMRDSELTPRQYVVLRAVADSEDPSQTTLVEKTGIDRSTLADIVRRLVERGLLQRRRTRRDARMYAVRLTDARRRTGARSRRPRERPDPHRHGTDAAGRQVGRMTAAPHLPLGVARASIPRVSAQSSPTP